MAFIFIFCQLHEMTHISVGRLVCGCWGSQVDFNLWQLCGSCFETNPQAYFATLAGPVFSFACMWAGVLMLKHKKYTIQLFGFFMIFGNVAFARILTAAMGGGDEITVLKILLAGKLDIQTIKYIGLAIVLIFALPPLVFAWKKLKQPHAFWIVLGFSVVPLLVQLAYEFKLLNSLLKQGILAESHLMGIADLIHIHTLLMVPIFIFCWRKVIHSSSTAI